MLPLPGGRHGAMLTDDEESGDTQGSPATSSSQLQQSQLLMHRHSGASSTPVRRNSSAVQPPSLVAHSGNTVAARFWRVIAQPLSFGHLLLWQAILVGIYLALPTPPPPPPPPPDIIIQYVYTPVIPGEKVPTDGMADPAALERTRAWVKPTEPNWWDDESTRGSYDFAADPTSSLTSPLTSREPHHLSSYALNLPLQPAFSDCRAFFDRPTTSQRSLEARLVAEHKRSALGKRLADNVQAPWLVRNMAELESALVAEQDKFVPALARWLLPELDRVGFMARPVPLRCTQHAIMLIESRSNPFVVFAVRNTFLMLSSDTQRWGLIIFHSPENERSLVEGLEIWPGGAGQHIVMHMMEQPDGVIDRNVGNKLILSSALWEAVPVQVENILLIQTDALMIKPAGADLPLWHKMTNQYAYVGAPFPQPSINPHPDMNWRFHAEDHTPFGGNGGLSFRKRSVMIDLTRQLSCDGKKVGKCWWTERFPPSTTEAEKDDTYDEDRWIGRQLYRRSYKYRHQIPFPEVARKFAVDTIWDADPFFVHKYWQMWNEHNLVERDVVKELVAGVKNYYRVATGQRALSDGDDE